MPTALPSSRPKVAGSVLALVTAIAACEGAGLVGVLVTDTGNSPWYRSLKKPSFNPPPSVFGPVWTALYAMMGVSAFLVWRNRKTSPAARPALVLFGLQLALNAIWTPVFFGFKSLGGAFAIILALWAAIAVTIDRFRRVSPVAAVLLIPYLLWVSFASVLNGSIFLLNRPAPDRAQTAAATDR